jgi:hypothetical protein
MISCSGLPIRPYLSEPRASASGTENHDAEEKRTPVGRPDFKSDERRQTLLVGSTPTLFRHKYFEARL